MESPELWFIKAVRLRAIVVLGETLCVPKT
jgi:hypothetical protein